MDDGVDQEGEIENAESEHLDHVAVVDGFPCEGDLEDAAEKGSRLVRLTMDHVPKTAATHCAKTKMPRYTGKAVRSSGWPSLKSVENHSNFANRIDSLHPESDRQPTHPIAFHVNMKHQHCSEYVNVPMATSPMVSMTPMSRKARRNPEAGHRFCTLTWPRIGMISYIELSCLSLDVVVVPAAAGCSPVLRYPRPSPSPFLSSSLFIHAQFA